jgi:hypothetical protein
MMANENKGCFFYEYKQKKEKKNGKWRKKRKD